MEMSDFTWRQQEYARPEIYVVTLLTLNCMICGRTSKHSDYDSIMLKNDKLFYGNVRFHLATPEIC